jgi:hypothetical protein
MSYTVVPASGTGNQIVQLDSTPPVRLTAGNGGQVKTFVITGSATAPVNMPTTNFLPIVRIPTNSVVHKVEIALDTAPSTSLTGSIGLTFSDAFNASPPGDGTQGQYASTYALTSATPSIVSQSFFFYQAAITSYVGLWTDVTFQNYTGNSVTDGFYVPSASILPLWQALTTGIGKATSGASPGAFTSCATEPFGFFDVVWFETTTGVNTSAVKISLRVTYSGEVQ